MGGRKGFDGGDMEAGVASRCRQTTLKWQLKLNANEDYAFAA